MLDVLKEVQLSDEQVKALDHFFIEHTENIRSEIESDFEGELSALKSEIEELKANPINESNETIKEEAKKELELFKENAEKAFNLLKEHSAKAFELYKADLKTQYSENMVEALQKLYVELEERVKEDFKSSDEYKAFEKMMNIAKPIVLKEKEELFEELETLKSEKEQLTKEKEVLSKKETINSLLESFPKEHVDEVRAFLEGASTEDEIFERFQAIGKTIEKVKTLKKEEPVVKKQPVVENKTEPKAAERKPVFESTTVEPKIVAPEKKAKQEITVEDYIHLLNAPSLI